MAKVIILTDYNSDFLISTYGGFYHSMDIKKIKYLFESLNFHVNVSKYSEINFDDNFNGTYVLYQSTEDNGQFYKRYIEDIIYYLQLKGAIALPEYKFLKAHHNKGFMELLRKSFKNEELKTITSNYYGNLVDIKFKNYKFPVVVKQISGSGSSGVLLARNKTELSKVVRRNSNGYLFNSILLIQIILTKNIFKILLNKFFSKNYLINVHKIGKPFIIQNFIKNLPGDYKVLYFGGKYYTLYRSNRKNDFRASGSGIFNDVPENMIEPLLNFSMLVVNEIDFPVIGMDIGFDGNVFHLIEFQMIHIGPITLERSKYFYSKVNNDWIMFESSSNLEDEFCRSIYEFIISKN